MLAGPQASRLAGLLCFCTGVCPRGVETASSERTRATLTGKWAGRGENVGWVLLGGFPLGWAPQKAALGASPSDSPTTAPCRACLRDENNAAAMTSPSASHHDATSELISLTRRVGKPSVTPVPELYVSQRSVMNRDIPEAFSLITSDTMTRGIENRPLCISSSLPCLTLSPFSFRAFRSGAELGCAAVCEAAVTQYHTLRGQNNRNLFSHGSGG